VVGGVFLVRYALQVRYAFLMRNMLLMGDLFLIGENVRPYRLFLSSWLKHCNPGLFPPLLFHDGLRQLVALHIADRNSRLFQFRISPRFPLFFSIPASYLGYSDLVLGLLLAKLDDMVIVFSFLLFLGVVLFLGLRIEGLFLSLITQVVVVQLLLNLLILFYQPSLLLLFLKSLNNLEGRFSCLQCLSQRPFSILIAECLLEEFLALLYVLLVVVKQLAYRPSLNLLALKGFDTITAVILQRLDDFGRPEVILSGQENKIASLVVVHLLVDDVIGFEYRSVRDLSFNLFGSIISRDRQGILDSGRSGAFIFALFAARGCFGWFGSGFLLNHDSMMFYDGHGHNSYRACL
jgi:hypothetical protein